MYLFFLNHHIAWWQAIQVLLYNANNYLFIYLYMYFSFQNVYF